MISLFLKSSLFIQIAMLFIFFYFYQRRKNRASNVEPRVRIFDKIFLKYYKLYFYRLKGSGDYPGLIHIYNAMAIDCQKQKIDSDTIKQVNKSINLKKNNTFFTFISGSLVFFGLTNFGNLTEHLSKLFSLIGWKSSSNLWIDISNYWKDNANVIGPIIYIVSTILLILICIILVMFFVRMDKDSNVIKYSKESQMEAIVEDFSRYYEQFNNDTTSEIFQLEDENIPLFNINVTRSKDETNIYIPATISETKKPCNTCFKNEARYKEVILNWKNNDKYKFHFKKLNFWELTKVEDLNGNLISETELKNLKILFEILFELANIDYSNNGRILKFINSLVNKIYKIQNRFWQYVSLFIFVLVLVLLSIFALFVLFLLIRIHMLYFIFLFFICFSISSWLLKNVHGL